MSTPSAGWKHEQGGVVQFWLWVSYVLVSLVLVAMLAYWSRKLQWCWRLLIPLWVLLVWPQPRELGDVELVPHWVGLLATLWSQMPAVIPWLLFPTLGIAFALGLMLDRWRNRRRAEAG